MSEHTRGPLAVFRLAVREMRRRGFPLSAILAEVEAEFRRMDEYEAKR